MVFDQEFIYAALVSVALVCITTLVYYEVLRLTWRALPHLKMAPRKRILLVVMAIFGGHTAAVWIYGIAFWLLDKFTMLGGLSGVSGAFQHSFHDFLYFSVTTYSSLGFGDVFPNGGMRLISGVEVVNGLVLIGWSASFTYLAMEKFWSIHPKKSSGRKRSKKR